MKIKIGSDYWEHIPQYTYSTVTVSNTVNSVQIDSVYSGGKWWHIVDVASQTSSTTTYNVVDLNNRIGCIWVKQGTPDAAAWSQKAGDTLETTHTRNNVLAKSFTSTADMNVNGVMWANMEQYFRGGVGYIAAATSVGGGYSWSDLYLYPMIGLTKISANYRVAPDTIKHNESFQLSPKDDQATLDLTTAGMSPPYTGLTDYRYIWTPLRFYGYSPLDTSWHPNLGERRKPFDTAYIKNYDYNNAYNKPTIPPMVSGTSAGQTIRWNGSLWNYSDVIRVGATTTIQDVTSVTIGDGNVIDSVHERALVPIKSIAIGEQNYVYEQYGYAQGVHSIVDGKIASAIGNTVMCSANDSKATGNRTVAGRRMYPILSHGVDTDADVGTKAYVIVDATEGDITAMFPNKLVTWPQVLTRYGVGATKDTMGNIYPSGMTKATYDGSLNIVNKNDLTWAMHSFLVIKGSNETEICFQRILKSTYNAVTGTKIYYDTTALQYSDITYVYGSYAPTVLADGVAGGNGQSVSGFMNSTYGYGANSSGFNNRSWNAYTNTLVFRTKHMV